MAQKMRPLRHRPDIAGLERLGVQREHAVDAISPPECEAARISFVDGQSVSTTKASLPVKFSKGERKFMHTLENLLGAKKQLQHFLGCLERRVIGLLAEI